MKRNDVILFRLYRLHAISSCIDSIGALRFHEFFENRVVLVVELFAVEVYYISHLLPVFGRSEDPLQCYRPFDVLFVVWNYTELKKKGGVGL